MRYALLMILFCAPPGALAQDQTAERIKALEQRLDKLEGTPAKTSLSAFNPAIGLALDTLYRQTHDRGNFVFRTAELNIEAPIDPFLNAWTVINANGAGVGVEEMGLETTALPHNLTLRGGRLFASFGRMGHFHDDSLPVIDRPNSLDTFIGGESLADGFEASYLLPTKAYINATAGMYNKLGATNIDRADDNTPRGLNKFTYLGRLEAALEFGDDHRVDLGVSSAWTPRRTVIEDLSTSVSGNTVGEVTKSNTWRTLSGIDLTYRWQPGGGGLYKGLVWGTELLRNNDRRFGLKVAGDNLPKDRVKAWAGYSYVQLKLGRHWRPGAMFDLTENIDLSRQNTKTVTAFVTYDVTEFQRLRAAYSRVANTVAGSAQNDIVGLQWTAFMGHHVHGFRDK